MSSNHSPHINHSQSQNLTSQFRCTSFQRSPMAPPTPIDSLSHLIGTMDGATKSRSSHCLIPMRQTSMTSHPLDRPPSCCNAIDGSLWFESSGHTTPLFGPKNNWANVVPLLSICASDIDGGPFPSPDGGRRGYKEAEMVWVVNQNDASLKSALNSVRATPERLRQTATASSVSDAHSIPRISLFPLWHTLPTHFAAQSNTALESTEAPDAQWTPLSDNFRLNDTVVPNPILELFDDDTKCHNKSGLTSGTHQSAMKDRVASDVTGDFWANINLPCPLGEQLSSQPKQFVEPQSLSTFLTT